MDFSLPSLPDFNALHVLVVHFPIALLMVAVPLMLLVAVLFTRFSRYFAVAAALFLCLGVGSAYIATLSGEAAEELAEEMGAGEDPVIHEAIEHHAEMAEQTRNAYAIFAAVFLLYLIISGLPRREWSPALNGVLLVLFLAASLAGALSIGNTAHSGGVLVHTHGLLAPLENGAAAAQAAEGAEDAAGEGEEQAENGG